MLVLEQDTSYRSPGLALRLGGREGHVMSCLESAQRLKTSALAVHSHDHYLKSAQPNDHCDVAILAIDSTFFFII